MWLFPLQQQHGQSPHNRQVKFSPACDCDSFSEPLVNDDYRTARGVSTHMIGNNGNNGLYLNKNYHIKNPKNEPNFRDLHGGKHFDYPDTFPQIHHRQRRIELPYGKAIIRFDERGKTSPNPTSQHSPRKDHFLNHLYTNTGEMYWDEQIDSNHNAYFDDDVGDARIQKCQTKGLPVRLSAVRQVKVRDIIGRCRRESYRRWLQHYQDVRKREYLNVMEKTDCSSIAEPAKLNQFDQYIINAIYASNNNVDNGFNPNENFTKDNLLYTDNASIASEKSQPTLDAASKVVNKGVETPGKDGNVAYQVDKEHNVTQNTDDEGQYAPSVVSEELFVSPHVNKERCSRSPHRNTEESLAPHACSCSKESCALHPDKKERLALRAVSNERFASHGSGERFVPRLDIIAEEYSASEANEKSSLPLSHFDAKKHSKPRVIKVCFAPPVTEDPSLKEVDGNNFPINDSAAGIKEKRTKTQSVSNDSSSLKDVDGINLPKNIFMARIKEKRTKKLSETTDEERARMTDLTRRLKAAGWVLTRGQVDCYYF